MSSNNPRTPNTAGTPNTAASASSQRSAASSSTSIGNARVELFGSATKRQAAFLKVKPSSAKRSKFNIKKSPKTPNSVPANNIPGFPTNATVHLVKVLPEKVEQPITGIIVCPTGYYMDRHLSNIMFSKYSDNRSTKTFIDTTGATHRCFDIKVEGGEPLVKYTKSKHTKDATPYPIKAIFIPMEPSDMDTEEKLKAYINDTFMPAFHNGILGTKDPKIQEDQMPRFNDMSQVRTVNNWSDAFFSQEDIGIIARLVLGNDDVTLNDWINHEDDNLYTLFHEGQIDPITVQQFRFPFDKLSVEDKNNYNYFMEQQTRINQMETEDFLESLVGKTHLTDTDKRNLAALKAYRAAQGLNNTRFDFFPAEEKKTDDGKASEGKASVSKSDKPKAKKTTQKKTTRGHKTNIPLTQRTYSEEEVEEVRIGSSDEDSDA